MRCPSLSELSSPPQGKAGWLWPEESLQLPDKMPDGSDWAKKSFATPSYNEGGFVEETIRLVLLQGHPNLECIICDGGSNDQSVETLRKYERWLTDWVSEKDHGQAISSGKSSIASGLFGEIPRIEMWR